LLERLIAQCTPLAADRALVLEGSQELERVYSELAVEGDSAVPENAEDEVEYHYVCFVQSNKSGCVYEMDGDCKGPIIRCLPDEERLDMLAEDVLDVVRSFVHRENGDNLGFNLMALAKGGIEGEL
jgi:ubiquitin carboxyl-terminal hydrolase L3